MRTIPDGYKLQGGAAIPTRAKTLAEVREGIARDRKAKDKTLASDMARLILCHGWISDEARTWLSQEYSQ